MVDTTHLCWHLLKRVHPIIAVHPGGTEFIGSSVLLQIRDRYFVVSAAHVLASAEPRRLRLLGDNQSVRLPDDIAFGMLPGSDGPGEDRVDVAFAELSRADVEELGGAAAVQIAELDVDESLEDRGPYLGIGYPGSKTKVHYSHGALHVEPFALHTGRAAPTAYTELGLSPNAHILLKYERSKIIGVDGTMRQGPLPFGMSGGGVWRVDSVHPAEPPGGSARLVGLLIKYRQVDHFILASRIALVLEGIRLKHCELAKAIPLSTVIRLNVNRGDLPEGAA